MQIQGYQVVKGDDKTHSSGLIFSNHDIWVPHQSWNPFSPAMHNVQDKRKNILYKLVKEPWKFTIFSSFLVKYFLIPCVLLVFLSKLNFKPLIFYLCNTASHLWRLHVLWRIELKTNKVHRQVRNLKKETLLCILEICMFYVRPWVN